MNVDVDAMSGVNAIPYYLYTDCTDYTTANNITSAEEEELTRITDSIQNGWLHDDNQNRDT